MEASMKHAKIFSSLYSGDLEKIIELQYNNPAIEIISLHYSIASQNKDGVTKEIINNCLIIYQYKSEKL